MDWFHIHEKNANWHSLQWQKRLIKFTPCLPFSSRVFYIQEKYDTYKIFWYCANAIDRHTTTYTTHEKHSLKCCRSLDNLEGVHDHRWGVQVWLHTETKKEMKGLLKMSRKCSYNSSKLVFYFVISLKMFFENLNLNWQGCCGGRKFIKLFQQRLSHHSHEDYDVAWYDDDWCLIYRVINDERTEKGWMTWRFQSLRTLLTWKQGAIKNRERNWEISEITLNQRVENR